MVLAEKGQAGSPGIRPRSLASDYNFIDDLQGVNHD